MILINFSILISCYWKCIDNVTLLLVKVTSRFYLWYNSSKKKKNYQWYKHWTKPSLITTMKGWSEAVFHYWALSRAIYPEKCVSTAFNVNNYCLHLMYCKHENFAYIQDKYKNIKWFAVRKASLVSYSSGIWYIYLVAKSLQFNRINLIWCIWSILLLT